MRRPAGYCPPEVTVVDRQRASRISPVRVGSFVEYALERERLYGSQVSLVLVGERAMRGLNGRWRGKSGPTDVLTFPQREGPGGGLHPEVLGDIVVCVPVAQRQARQAGHCLAAEIDRLALHGVLHLAGYTHEADPVAARAMRRREEAIMKGWRR